MIIATLKDNFSLEDFMANPPDRMRSDCNPHLSLYTQANAA